MPSLLPSPVLRTSCSFAGRWTPRAARRARSARAGLWAFLWARARVLPRRGQECGGEWAARRGDQGGAIGVRALILGGARSGKSAFAERLASSLGGERVLYVATAIDDGDEDLQRRIRLHRERRPRGWGTLEIGVLDEVLNAAEEWDTVLLDSLTLWVSARDEPALPEFDRFLTRAESQRASLDG